MRTLYCTFLLHYCCRVLLILLYCTTVPVLLYYGTVLYCTTVRVGWMVHIALGVQCGNSQSREPCALLCTHWVELTK